MTICLKWVAGSGLLVLMFALTGCGPGQPHPAPRVNPARQKPAQESVPREVTTRGITIRWYEKIPPSGIRRVMDVNAKSGMLNAEQQSGLFNQADGVFYRDNQARARFTAPVVEAAKGKNTVIARGRVVVHSIDPPGVTVTADRLTWYADKNKIVAEGHVDVTYQPPGAPRPTGWGSAPRITFDTELKKFRLP